MAVDALQLRPRGAVALFDAAVRVCATSSGVWALTLPTGAAVVAAVFGLAEAVRRGQDVRGPAALLTLAWLLRAVAQGAACHHLEQQLLATQAPSLGASVRAALRRAPGLLTASVVMLALDLALWVFTLGLGFLFLGAHAAGYATVMRGQGSALRVYATASRLLGPARHAAPWVRVCGLSQGLLAVNLQLAVMLALYLLRALLGFEVSFLQRLTAPDDAVWVAVVAATAFALFEPLRAATAALLLVDGRVRQEGLDLLALVEQLPRRARPGAAAAAGALLVALFATPALAGPTLLGRLEALEAFCGIEGVSHAALRPLGERDQAALSRFVSRLERTAHDDEDCERAEAALTAGLAVMAATPARTPGEADPAALARATLAQAEFQVAPPRPEAEAAPPPEDGWWDELWRRLRAWLRSLEQKELPTELPAAPNPLAAADVVVALALAAVAAVLGVLLARAWSARRPAPVPTESAEVGQQTPLAGDVAGALTRPPQGWAELADALAARGEFREAIRHLYLALLARLHRDGVITYDPAQSNWQYLRAFRGSGTDKLAFRELTRRFDFAWYGRQEADPSAWARFRHTAQALLARPEAADA
jgi:Domain of unknown function (DUF4129)